MIGGIQPKLLVYLDENENIVMDQNHAELLGVVDTKFNWELVRERDKLTKQSERILWLEWNDDGRFKEKYDEPSVGLSLIMSPFNEFFTWQTTPITEIVEQRDGYIKFNTKNSVYTLLKLNQDESKS
jgi:hypothetical protein